ncbi:MAG: magnesium transporter CorA family protein [Chlamydiae bacterium]|nr:magnesium transporter CorA family protein [Chlamydiota bacterium]
MISYYFKHSKDSEFAYIDAPVHGCWINVEDAISYDLQKVCEITGLEFNSIQDALDRYEIPRIEKNNGHILLFLRHPIEVESGLYTMSLTIIITPHYFITIGPSNSSFIKNFLTKKGKTPDSHSLKVLIQLLLRITQEFTLQIRRVRHNVLTQQKEMIHVGSDDISDLTRHEEILNQYHSSLVPLRNVLESLLTGKVIALHEKDQEHIDDVLNAIRQSEDLCSIVNKTIRSLRDSYQIIFTNNLNKTIKLLTALTIIFSIPTMIASLYGMNVALPWSDFRHMFGLLVTLIVTSSIICFYLFRKKGWL